MFINIFLKGDDYPRVVVYHLVKILLLSNNKHFFISAKIKLKFKFKKVKTSFLLWLKPLQL